MDKDENLRLPMTVTPSKPSSNDRPPMRTGGRERLGIYLESTEDEQWGVLPHECTRIKDARGLTALPVRDSSGLLSGIVTEALGAMVIFLFVAPLIIASWLSVAWSADVTPAPPPLGSRPENPQGPAPPAMEKLKPGGSKEPPRNPSPR